MTETAERPVLPGRKYLECARKPWLMASGGAVVGVVVWGCVLCFGQTGGPGDGFEATALGRESSKTLAPMKRKIDGGADPK